MILLKAAQLMRLQQRERCLNSGKQRGAEDQNRDAAQHDAQSKGAHFCGTKPGVTCVAFPARRTETGIRRPSEELVVLGLLIL